MASSTQVRRVLLQIQADDGDTETKIDAITAKADELGKLHPELKVRIDTAAASAKLRVLRDELTAATAPPPPIVPEVDDAPADERIAALQVQIGALSEDVGVARLDADDADAQVKLLRLQAQLADLGEKVTRPEISGAGILRAQADVIDLQAKLAEMTATPVGIPVAPAVAGLDDLKARLDEITRKAAGIKVEADDADARVKILGIQARLAELGDKVARPDISVSGVARAHADIASVALQLDALKPKLPSGGGIGELSSVFSGGLMSPAGIAVIAQGVQVLLPEVGALATGLTAAGVGAGSFALLAEPAFGKVHTAYTKIQADQKAYDNALTSSQRKTALAHLKQDWKALDPAETGAVKGVQQLTGEFGRMSKAFEPAAFKVFDAGLKDANKLLPYIDKFANSAAPAIEGLFSGLGKFLGGGQFKDFAKFLASLEGPSIKAIGSGFAGLVPDVMNLMELFSKKDVVNSINIAFRAVGFALTLVTDVIKVTMWEWDTLTREVHGVSSEFDAVRHGAAILAHDIGAHFDEARHDVAGWAGDVERDAGNVVHWFEQLPGEVGHALGNLGSLLYSEGKSVISGFIHGIEDEVPGLQSVLSWVTSKIPSWKGPMNVDARLLTPNGIAIMGSLVAGIDAGMPALHAKLKRTTDAIGTVVTSELQGKAPVLAAATRRMTQALSSGIVESDLTGTAAQVRAGIARLVSVVNADMNAGALSSGNGSALTSWLEADSARLQADSTKRAKILATIKTAEAYAGSVASTLRGQDNLSSASAGGFNGGPQTNKQIVANLRLDVANINKFSQNIKRLQRMGLNKDYLSQLISMGPDAGGQLAEQLATGGLADIRQVNAAESSIVKTSAYLGKTAANVMYDSGANAGKGFLSGLESQQKALEKVMSKLASTMVNTIKRDLGIHSPSTVARQLAREWPNGLILGLEDGHSGVQTASAKLARAVASHGSGGGAGGSSGGQVVTVRFDLSGAPREFRTLLKKSIRTTGGNVEIVGA